MNCYLEQHHIVQIIEAAGWEAVYNIDGKEEATPLACWALVESRCTRHPNPDDAAYCTISHQTGDRTVVGLDAYDGIEPAVTASNFVRYEPPRPGEAAPR